MKASFAFEKEGKHTFGTVYRPIARIFFKSPKEEIWVGIRLVVDTGADFTILPKYLANNLKISLTKDCKKDESIGIGGTQIIYLYKKKLKIKVGELIREVPVAFFDSNELPGLLGRLGFIETFDVEFLKSHEVIFKD